VSEVKEDSVENIEFKKASPKKIIISLIVIVVVLFIFFGCIFGFKAMVDSKKKAAMATWKMRPASVSAVKAKLIEWVPYIESVGETQSINGVDITAQVAGVVTSIDFESGQTVKKGDKIFEIQHDDYDAQLAQNKASMEIAKITYLRDKKLYENNAASAQTLDQSLAQYQEAEAAVANTQAQIDYHIVRAPFDGQLGIRQINLDEYFQAGSTAVTLNQIQPIYVDFNVVESDVAKLYIGQEVEVESTAYPGMKFKGKVTSFNSTLSQDTRALAVQATLPNDGKKQKLLPGMFTTTHLMLPVQKNVVTVPSSSVNYTLYGDTVYVLKPKMENGKQLSAEYSSMKDGSIQMVDMHQPLYTAIETPVKMGMTKGLESAVLKGINSGDYVVTSGQVKLKNGSDAVINNKAELNNPNMSSAGVSTKKSEESK
jgi:membrane fusion protein (multidrug efflux system)